jgi:hypothetical protein
LLPRSSFLRRRPARGVHGGARAALARAVAAAVLVAARPVASAVRARKPSGASAADGGDAADLQRLRVDESHVAAARRRPTRVARDGERTWRAADLHGAALRASRLRRQPGHRLFPAVGHPDRAVADGDVLGIAPDGLAAPEDPRSRAGRCGPRCRRRRSRPTRSSRRRRVPPGSCRSGWAGPSRCWRSGRSGHRTRPLTAERCQRSDRYAAPQGCGYAAFTHLRDSPCQLCCRLRPRRSRRPCVIGPVAPPARRW